MAIPQSKNQYEPRSIVNFEALEQTGVGCANFQGLDVNTFLQLAELIKATVYTKFRILSY